MPETHLVISEIRLWLLSCSDFKAGQLLRVYQLVNVSVGQNLFISTGMDNFPEDAHEVAGLDIF